MYRGHHVFSYTVNDPGYIEAFQINTAYYTKLKLSLRHDIRMDPWIGLDKLLKNACFTKICALKDEPFLKGVAKWTVAPVVMTS